MVTVDLLVGAEVDGGSGWDGGQQALQVSVEHQVAPRVQAGEALPDADALASRKEDKLRLPGQLATCSAHTLPSSRFHDNRECRRSHR